MHTVKDLKAPQSDLKIEFLKRFAQVNLSVDERMTYEGAISRCRAIIFELEKEQHSSRYKGTMGTLKIRYKHRVGVYWYNKGFISVATKEGELLYFTITEEIKQFHEFAKEDISRVHRGDITSKTDSYIFWNEDKTDCMLVVVVSCRWDRDGKFYKRFAACYPLGSPTHVGKKGLGTQNTTDYKKAAGIYVEPKKVNVPISELARLAELEAECEHLRKVVASLSATNVRLMREGDVSIIKELEIF